MLEAPARNTSGLDGVHLDQLRHLGDPPADRLAAALLREHPGLDERDLVRLVLDQLGTRTIAGPDADGARTTVRDWLFDGPPLPDWADPARIRHGQEFFARWPLPIAAALFCGSLPGAYAAADGARVLTMTSDLATNHHLARRAVETGQMLFDVMDLGSRPPDALRPGGRGYLTIRGVRLLHGVVRQNLLATRRAGLNPEAADMRWSSRAWGRPVNQEDLLGTLLTFTVVVFHGLDRLGIPYRERDADAYMHTWNVIGHLIGIQPDLLPFDRIEGERLALLIASRHHKRSDAGARLTEALLRHMEVSMPLGLRKLPRTLIRRLLPAPVPELLDVPPAAWWSPAVTAMAQVGPLLARLPGGRQVVQAPTATLGRAVLRTVVDRGLNGQQPSFRLDPAIVDQLSLRTSALRRSMRQRRRRIRAAR